MDVIACHQAGIENTIAVSGTALTEEQLAMLRRYGKEMRFFFDMDEAGQKAARRSTELALSQDIEVSIVSIPEGKDAADLAQEHPEAVREAIADPSPALKYFLTQILARFDIETPRGKKEALAAFVPFIVAAKSPIDRAYWIKELAQSIKVEEKDVHGVVHGEQKEREKRSKNLPKGQDVPFHDATVLFVKRSERLREELIAVMLAFPSVRALVRGTPDERVLCFLEKHPLYFFIVQAGDESQPVDLIEDRDLKMLASRLLFRILDGPDFSTLMEEERVEKAQHMAQRLMTDMKKEVIRNEELVGLEHDLEAARRAGAKEKEKELLMRFALLSRENQ